MQGLAFSNIVVKTLIFVVGFIFHWVGLLNDSGLIAIRG